MAHAPVQQDAGDRHKQLPRPGLMAIVRNRRGIVAAVEPFDAGTDGTLHMVTVEYTDTDGPREEQLLWEREPSARVVSPNAIPNVLNHAPMTPREFDALQDATRWSSVTPFLDPDNPDERADDPVAAPFYGAVQSEDFQLVPLLKAMRMPRVSLMLADDVGLGKTIEAGLILRELLLRRRARRVLILTPASLQQQWREEMQEKFSLGFNIVDRESTQDLKKKMGLDANPWRFHSRIIASYHYLRQPDIREQFRAATERDDASPTSAKLPWDMLIVDEAHNLRPNAVSEDSQLAKMLRDISPWFEHKLFLTATPHDGYTRSFTGLLESLDPVRFEQKFELDDRDHDRIDDVVVRRLKRDINQLDESRDRPRRFAKRIPKARELNFTPAEHELSDAFRDFRSSLKSAVGRSQAAHFAVQILNKRLLSGPYTFADSWLRVIDGIDRDEAADDSQVRAAQRAAERDLDDDRERESSERQAARTTGAWLKPYADDLADEINAVNNALRDLGISPEQTTVSADGETVEDLPVPDQDARYDQLKTLVDDQLRHSDDDAEHWVQNERLIIFTEYKTTLDYLVSRLRDDFDDPDGKRIDFLFGGMSQSDRADVKRRFNDPRDPVRILVGTDAASEGLNLQETARMVLHFDVPWNPSVLDQRNGRVDRHGQARDVYIYHFTSDDDADTEFMARVVGKVEEIREDLGSMGELFESAFEKRFIDNHDADSVFQQLNDATNHRRGRTQDAHTGTQRDILDQTDEIDDFKQHLGLTPDRLANTLEVALGMNSGYPQLDGPEDDGRYRIHGGEPPQDWKDIIDDELRVDPGDIDGRIDVLDALPKLAFDPEQLVEQTQSDGSEQARPVFRNPGDTVLMHLGHPVFRHALARFARQRFPSFTTDSNNATRWLVRHTNEDSLPNNADALVELTVEEMAVNELREPFHHWLRTLAFPIHDNRLGEPLDQPDESTPDRDARHQPEDLDSAVQRSRNLAAALDNPLTDAVDDHRRRITDIIENSLDDAQQQALDEAEDRFERRRSEVKQTRQNQNVPALKRELDSLRREQQQLDLMVERERELQQAADEVREKLAERNANRLDNLLERLDQRKQRMIQHVIPKRHSLSGDVQVFPVTLEFIFPENE